MGASTSQNPPRYRTTGEQLWRSSSVRWHGTVIQGLRNMNSFPDPHIKIRGGARISFRDIFVNLESQSARFAGVCTVCMCWSFILSAKWVTADSTGSSKTYGQCGLSWLLVGLTCTRLMLFWSTLVVTRPAGSCLLVTISTVTSWDHLGANCSLEIQYG